MSFLFKSKDKLKGSLPLFFCKKLNLYNNNYLHLCNLYCIIIISLLLLLLWDQLTSPPTINIMDETLLSVSWFFASSFYNYNDYYNCFCVHKLIMTDTNSILDNEMNFFIDRKLLITFVRLDHSELLRFSSSLKDQVHLRARMLTCNSDLTILILSMREGELDLSMGS